MGRCAEPPERSVERDEALALALPQVPALGWGWRAVEEGLRGAGPREGGRGEGARLEAELLFPGGAVDMVEAFIDRADRAMGAIAAGPGFAELRTTAKVRALVLGRLALLGPHREAVRRSVAGLPSTVITPLASTAKLATYLEAWVAQAAGSCALMSACEAELTSSVTAVLQGVAASIISDTLARTA